MMLKPDPARITRLAAILALGLAICAPALADNLTARPGDPLWMHVGANALLWSHILGGTIGMLTGSAAIFLPKGTPLHRLIGRIFFAAMFITYLVGAGVAPFLEEGQRPNFVAGIMALFLLITAADAARRRDFKAGWPQWAGLGVALAITAAGLLFMAQGARDPSGTVDGSPPQAFILFTVTGVFAALGEVHVLIRKRLEGPARIARHLWRMCMSLFIASGSFFLGQQQMLPASMQGTWFQFGPVLLPLVAIVVFSVWIRIRKRPAASRSMA